MNAIILRADARAIPLADRSVDLIVTSPPYFALRSYTDGGQHYAGQIGSEATPADYIDALIDCTREMVRVLKPAGSIWVDLGDKYAEGQRRLTPRDDRAGIARQGTRRGAGFVATDERVARPKSLMLLPERYRIACVDQLGLIARAVVIWSKPNGLPESVTDRVRRSHEDWVHLVKQPRYFSAVDEIRENYSPNKPWGRASTSAKHGLATAQVRGTTTDQQQTGLAQNNEFIDNPLGKLPSSVWTIPTEPLTVPDHLGVDHFAAFPTEWPRRIILGWSPVRSIVLDPFGGTGTSVLVAHTLGRIGISVDRSADYNRLAQWRTTNPGQIAHAMRVAKPQPVADAQLTLDLGGVT